MKKLFYVVEKELHSFDSIEETTGMKRITTYKINNGDLVEFFSIECSNDCDSQNEIHDYLGGNILFELIEL